MTLLTRKSTFSNGSRLAAVSSVALAAAMVVSACAPGQSDDDTGGDRPAEEVEDPEGPASLVVWTDAARQPGFEAYQEANPDVDLQIETLPEDLDSRLLLANQAGSGWPDVVWTTPFYSTAFPEAPFDLSADISPYLPDDLMDGYAPGVIQNCLGDDGEVFCLRNDIAPLVLWYNAELMEEFGYEVPTTWEELEELGLRVADEHPGYVVDAVAPMRNHFWASRCPVHEVAGERTLRVDLQHPNCTRMASLLDNLAEAGALAPFLSNSPEFIDEYGEPQKILTQVGPIFQGVSRFQNAYGWPDGILGVAPPLRWEDEDEVYNISGGGGFYTVSRHTEYPQAATDLVVWMATGEYQTDPETTTFPAYGPAQSEWIENNTDFFVAADGDVSGVIEQATDALWDEWIDVPIQSVVNAVNEVVTPAVVGEGRRLTELLPAWEERIINEAGAAGWTTVKDN